MLGRILLAWSFDPTVVVGLAALAGTYWLYAVGPRSTFQVQRPRNARLFTLALVLTLLALESPLDFLADHYLFSVHMVQHLILILGVAPLLAITTPPALLGDVRRGVPGWIRRVLGQPVLVLAVAVADVWAWHAPALYEAALLHEPIHVLEHLSFVATAYLFWLVALAPNDPLPGLPVLARMAYVFAGAFANTLLGVVLTFAPALYPSYGRALDAPGLGRALQFRLGLTPAADQQMGGLIMWVPGGLVYLAMIIAIFASWSAEARPEPVPAVTVIYPVEPMETVRV